ncbi:MAG: hypothetical protein ACKOQX_07385, partial [Actinomycetota bacterium]
MSRQKSTRFVRTPLAIGVVIGALLGSVGGVVASTNLDSIAVCANKTSGVMRYLAKGKCTGKEEKISWSQTGATGPAGPA